MTSRPPRHQIEDGIPWMLSRRINRKVANDLGLPWTYRHDIAAARHMFKAGAIDTEKFHALVDEAKANRPKHARGFRLW